MKITVTRRRPTGIPFEMTDVTLEEEHTGGEGDVYDKSLKLQTQYMIDRIEEIVKDYPIKGSNNGNR